MQLTPDLNPKREKSFPGFNPDFQPAAMHRRYINYALAHNGQFDIVLYAAQVSTKSQVAWLESSMRKMSDAGWFSEEEPGLYRLHPLVSQHLAERVKVTKSFQLGKRHKQLLALHSEGNLNLNTAREALLKKIATEKERSRQKKMLKGMIRTLKKEGYLEASDQRGQYRLTVKALQELEQPISERNRRKKTLPAGISLTSFDAHLIDICDEYGRINLKKLKEHPKSESLQKRISTLIQHGFIDQNIIKDALYQRLLIKEQQTRQLRKQLRLDFFLPEQQTLLNDVRQFETLTVPQIVEYLYGGDQELTMLDLRSMISQGILRYESQYALIALDRKGIVLADGIEYRETRYKTKVHSRPEEIAHDLLLYPSYKQFEQGIIAEGGKVLRVMNDQHLRRERALSGRYDLSRHLPDLRIHYVDGEGRERMHDIEADIDYDERTIANKLDSFQQSLGAENSASSGMAWVTSSTRQAQKVARALRRRENEPNRRVRLVTIYVMDENGKVRLVRW